MRVTREDIIGVLLRLPDDKLEVVYDFVSYLQARALQPHEAEEAARLAQDLFGSFTEEQLKAEDMLWDKTFETTKDKLEFVAREAHEEYLAGRIS